ncbi:MAG: SDR family oxidoreductase [Verrucomicrobia bacterium]|nr:SDR family oxidoreductase [Verrucomicrobiota bacterium]MDA1068053.1 SDR family oxidoreductase [Verrucomicrobiota bacterium]
MKRALVTGANRGIGLEVVNQFLKRNFHVILACRNRRLGEEAAQSLGKLSSNVTVFELDVSSQDSVDGCAETVSEQFDSLDVLVNNAGILIDRPESILTVTEDELNQTWNTNSLGPLRVTRAFLPLLRRSPDARVINVSSLSGQLKGMGTWSPPAYSISKTALNAVTRILASELASENIKVNCISPGWIKTGIGGANAPGTLEEGADTIVWLAGEAAAEITGQFLQNRKSVEW